MADKTMLTWKGRPLATMSHEDLHKVAEEMHAYLEQQARRLIENGISARIAADGPQNDEGRHEGALSS
ncbi:hypothetical protein MKK70_21230 [Methylobacterium sp. E-041]|uniref:hypothetical protein n=1 Tax=Methylobacterium sp. E-041 TaxID=2836573 RepID=UPI001FBB6618|nr:hypothetical protein [Methylobacterium sp. E-041]MCJ2107853.1 hypothetical protein [Methylobacterium sp. E-041]